MKDDSSLPPFPAPLLSETPSPFAAEVNACARCRTSGSTASTSASSADMKVSPAIAPAVTYVVSQFVDQGSGRNFDPTLNVEPKGSRGSGG